MIDREMLYSIKPIIYKNHRYYYAMDICKILMHSNARRAIQHHVSSSNIVTFTRKKHTKNKAVVVKYRHNGKNAINVYGVAELVSNTKVITKQEKDEIFSVLQYSKIYI